MQGGEEGVNQRCERGDPTDDERSEVSRRKTGAQKVRDWCAQNARWSKCCHSTAEWNLRRPISGLRMSLIWNGVRVALSSRVYLD